MTRNAAKLCVFISALSFGATACIHGPITHPPLSETEVNTTHQAVSETIQSYNSEFTDCYQRETESNRGSPKIEVQTEFTIGPDGNVTKANLKWSTFAHVELEDCVIEVIRNIKDFPRPLDGRSAQVEYPFRFGSGSG